MPVVCVVCGAGLRLGDIGGDSLRDSNGDNGSSKRSLPVSSPPVAGAFVIESGIIAAAASDDDGVDGIDGLLPTYSDVRRVSRFTSTSG